MNHNNSLFEQELRKLPLQACRIFESKGMIVPVSFKEVAPLTINQDINAAFPNLSTMTLEARPMQPKPKKKLRVAAFFSGGPAAGGHNVLVGLSQILHGQGHTLLGIRDGPGGLLKGSIFNTNHTDILHLANSGGFDYLGTDRTKINTLEQIKTVKEVCKTNAIDAIVVIGGDDSNTNAAFMAEHLKDANIQVIGVPKTMDGDVQFADLLPTPFGYHTACSIYSETVGNILQDTPSSRKYWHFVKLMGREASQVLLEVALQTQPHIAIISEEVEAKQQTLTQIIEDISDKIIARSRNGMNYGVVLIPEGLLEFTYDIKKLLDEINELFGKEKLQIQKMPHDTRIKYFSAHLVTKELFASLPQYIQQMLVADRDLHGNLQVSQIATERLVSEMVAARVAQKGGACSTQTHSLGYEGRCGAPTPFDAMLGYNLGLTAGSLVLCGYTGYMAAFTDFTHKGKVLGLPLKGLLTHEHREGKDIFVIKKALVRLDSPAFEFFAKNRQSWSEQDLFCSPGPRQYWGPTAAQMPISVILNQKYNSKEFKI